MLRNNSIRKYLMIIGCLTMLVIGGTALAHNERAAEPRYDVSNVETVPCHGVANIFKVKDKVVASTWCHITNEYKNQIKANLNEHDWPKLQQLLKKVHAEKKLSFPANHGPQTWVKPSQLLK